MRAAALAAALAFSWANRAGCCWLAGHTPHTVVGPVAAESPAPAPVGAPAVRALVFGDFGDDTCQQAEVARGFITAQARTPFDLAISVGDNLYECGPDPGRPGAAACDFAADGSTVTPGFVPPDDPRFGARFEGPLAPLQRGPRPLPIYLVLGNHDVAAWGSCGSPGVPAERLGRLRACLEVAHRGPGWQMPGRHWVVDRGPARFIGLDSNVLARDYGGFTLEAEAAFLREATRGCEARPCFVVGHHPPATAGGHADELLRPDATSPPRVRRLLEAASGPIAAWLAGHDHDLQHLSSPAGYDVFVSGNGSRWREEKFASVGPAGARLHFASTAWGHAVLEVWPGHWSVRIEESSGRALHCCRATFPGPCLPAACG